MACSTSPVPSDSESVSSLSSCDSDDCAARPTLNYSFFYCIAFGWPVYNHFHDAGVSVEELCSDVLHCFVKYLITPCLPKNSNYWANAVHHYCDDGLRIYLSIGGPFPKDGPINAVDRLTHLLQNAFLDFSASKGVNIDAMKIQDIVVSKVDTEFESVVERLTKDEQRHAAAVDSE